MGPIEKELRAGPQKDLSLEQWIGFSCPEGGMSIEAFKVVHKAAWEHGFEKYRFPEDVLSYAIEAAEALSL